VSIKPARYSADYHFMPHPGGGYYGMGFGLLLGDLTETINSSINMMMDGAHKATLGAGFIGSEARLRGGFTPLRPGEYRQIEARGQDLRAAIVPEPAAGASPVMFQLLGLLLDAANGLANTKDIQELSQRSNMPATTTLALIEQGMQVYGAIFKRVHRAMGAEFGMIARFNAERLDPEEYQRFHDAPVDAAADYNLADDDIEPVADPRAVTSPQKMAQANLLREMGATGEIDRMAATVRVLDAANVPDQEELLPKPDPAAAAIADAQMRAAMLMNVETALRIAELESKIAKLDAETMKVLVEAEVADPTSPLAVAKMELEALKERLRGNADAGRAGRMAGASGDGARAVGLGGGGGSAAGEPVVGLLGVGAEQPGSMAGAGQMGASAGFPGLA
jgi:chaperonin GroES